MPKNLTDVSQWDTVAVPVDTDAADAASVETPFQLLTDRTKYLIDYITGIRLSQWFYVEHDSFISWGSLGTEEVPCDICYVPGYGMFSAIDDSGKVIIGKDPGSYIAAGGDQPGGQGDGEWQEESNGTGLQQGNTYTEIAARGATRVAVGDSATSGIVAESSVIGTWTIRSTVNSVSFHCVGSGSGVNKFVIGGAGGALETSADGITWTSRTSGITDTVRLVMHNGREAAESVWMALSDTKVSTSSNGVTWSSTTHGFISNPLRMTYDAREDKWWVLRVNGSLAWSDNDGASWTGVTGDPLGLLASAPILKYEAGLASDGQGNLIVTYETFTGTLSSPTTVDSRRWAVLDDGSEYVRVYSPRLHGCQQGGVCFGADRFVTAGDKGGNFSLRVLEP
jgi:hypothetical protein